MAQRIFLVDVEASGKSPHSGVMTEFGVVDFSTGDWFHGHLWDFTPDPLIPAVPVPTRKNPGVTTGGREAANARYDLTVSDAVFADLVHWVTVLHPGRPVFVSDNPGFDAMWMTYGFDEAGVENPFGHSSRRIGDFAAGLAGDWRRASAWKKHRRTTHDHNPVNDALGNAEALATLLKTARPH